MRARKLIQCDGQEITIAELAERAGLKINTVYMRLHHGWTPARILSTPKVAPGMSPLRKPSLQLFEGKLQSVREIADATGQSRATISRRIRSGKPVDAQRCFAGQNPRRLTFQGKTQSLSAWANEIGLRPGTLTARLNEHGWTVEEALGTPRLAKGQRKPGGYVETSTDSLGTGGGRNARDFETGCKT